MKNLAERFSVEKLTTMWFILAVACILWVLCEIAAHLRELTMRPPVLIVTEPRKPKDKAP